jgi:hypothetical protein
MPLDTNLMYGEMVGSWFVHLAIPIAVATLLSVIPGVGKKVLILLFLTSVISFFVHFGFLTFLQANSCSGVKSYRTIFVGALLGAVLTFGMSAIPALFEPMRLVVSQLFGEHKSLLTPEMARINTIVTRAGLDVTEHEPVLQQGGAALSPEEYEAQTFQETVYGVAYWSAFAGAYGIGLGSLFAGKCPASS